MDDYFTGAVLQLLARAGQLNTRVPRDVPREFHTLVSACQAEVTRIAAGLRLLLEDAAMLLPANQTARLRMYRRAVADLDFVETVGFAAIERANHEDLHLNGLMDRIRLETGYPLLPPVVTSLSKTYFQIYPSLNLLSVPLIEGRFLLHLPDLYHELGHPLLRASNNPVVEPLQQALNQIMEVVLTYLDRELEEQERRRGPAQMLAMLECWVRSWVSWSVEFLCDLFATYMVGPAFAWSHLHLCAKRGGDPHQVPFFVPTSHPPDAARMVAILKGLGQCGFSEEVVRIQERWAQLLALLESKAEPEFRRCFPDQVLSEVCRMAQNGVKAIGCRMASPASVGEVYTLLNEAWDKFWKDPSGYRTWEESAVADHFSPGDAPSRRTASPTRLP